jgi:sugar phosphate isomerase/epimerase
VPLALSTSCFPADRWQIALAKVSWAGYDEVELWSDPTALPDPGELQDRLAANNLRLAAVRVGGLPNGTGDTESALAAIGRAMVLCHSCDGVRVIINAPHGGTLTELRERLVRLDRVLGPVPTELCLVNCPGTLLRSAPDFGALWRPGLPSRVGIALDPARAALAGLEADLAPLPEAPRHLYLVDLLGERPAPPLEGELDLPALVSEARQRRPSVSLSVLMENADPWDVEPAAKRTGAELHALGII